MFDVGREGKQKESLNQGRGHERGKEKNFEKLCHKGKVLFLALKRFRALKEF